MVACLAMRIHARLTGTTALLMHNIRLANPDDQFAKAIAKITSKRTKTEEDRLEIAHLEFLGGLYVGKSGPYIPAANVRRCLKETAKVRRLGKQIDRAVVPVMQEFALAYKGPRDPEALWKDETFRQQEAARVGTSRVQRMRPRFLPWALDTEWELISEVLDHEDFIAVFKAAGIVEGLGDNRINGFGRFNVEIGNGAVPS